jgi:phytoene desaturase
MPELYAQTFADLGERMEDHLELRRIDPTYQVYFGDGSTLALTSDLSRMKAQLEAIEIGSFDGFLRYLGEGHRHYTLALPNLVQRNFRNLLEFCSLRNLILLFKVKLLVKHYANIGRYFYDRRLKAAFTFQDMYLSLNPYEAPATFSLFQYAELARGIWFPIGGMTQVVGALTHIAEKLGVRFKYNTEVERINVNSRQATGVTLVDGREIGADVVVANADLPYVYHCLLPDDGSASRLARKKYSCSAVTFYWGVDRQYPQFGPHNLFLAGDYRRSFDRILRDLTLPEEPSFYLHAPARIDPSMAPPGEDTLMVVVPVGHIDDAQPQDWRTIQEQARRCVLQRLGQAGASDLSACIKFEVSYTPPDWRRRYNLTKGSTLGLAHNLLQMGFLRPRNQHRRYRNLYFVGASTHPGNGAATVLISARLTTERILQDANARQQPTAVPDSTSLQRHSMDKTQRVHERHQGIAKYPLELAPLGPDVTIGSSEPQAEQDWIQ